MLGNLKAFESDAQAIDLYSEYLRTIGEPVIPKNGALWALRVILLVSFVVHIVGVAQLAARNRAARPMGKRPAVIKRSFSTRTMQLGGVILLLFVVFHILQFTTGTIDPGSFVEGAVFQNLNAAFDKWYFVAIYVIAVVALGFHLRHAVWSFFQTGGWDKPNRNPDLSAPRHGDRRGRDRRLRGRAARVLHGGDRMKAWSEGLCPEESRCRWA